jgi:uncharacterized protein (TIGR03067 family)
MLTSIALAVITALLVTPPDDAKEDLKKLEGVWKLVSGEKDGKIIDDATLRTARLVIKGDTHTVKVGEDSFIGTHKVNPDQKPKAIDAMDTEGTYKGKTSLGIYEIKGDEFKVCFAPPGKERPKEFTSKSGTGNMVHVWKRETK